jgi:SRSO17 transposase
LPLSSFLVGKPRSGESIAMEAFLRKTIAWVIVPWVIVAWVVVACVVVACVAPAGEAGVWTSPVGEAGVWTSPAGDDGVWAAVAGGPPVMEAISIGTCGKENQMSNIILEQELGISTSELVADLNDFNESVFLDLVDNTEKEKIWTYLMRTYHYLGYGSTIGGRVKYLVSLGQRLVGGISYCSGAYKLGPRDQFIGWNESTRLEYLPHLLNNNRFLILPWIKVRNLASHTLALSLKMVREDWAKQYGVEPYMAETFVDREKYKGTCYLASNWKYLGTTKGFGRLGNSFTYHGHEKDIYVYILNRNFNKIFQPNTNHLYNESDEILGLITGVPMDYEKIVNNTTGKKIELKKLDTLLADHIMRYTPYLGRKEHKTHFVAIIKGLLSNLDRKTLGQIAIAYESKIDERKMSFFMTRSIFDNEGMLEEYQKDLAEVLSGSIGMITGDVCDFIREGKQSVGIARQFSSNMDKVCNCQSSVIAGYSNLIGCGIIDYALYMPKLWFDKELKPLRERCIVPKNLKYYSKNQMLLMMINKAIATEKFSIKYIGVGIPFGESKDFLDSIPKNIVYFSEIPKSYFVFTVNHDIINLKECNKVLNDSEQKLLKLLEVKDILVDSNIPWEDIKLGIGKNGLIIEKDKILKIVECRNGKPGKNIWLYIRQLQDESIKFAICNEPIGSPKEKIREIALMRWPIGQCLRDCRERLGMDNYEVRSWPGWRRHLLFTFISHLFTVKLNSLLDNT